MKTLFIIAIFLITCSAMPTDSQRKQMVCCAYATGYAQCAIRIMGLQNHGISKELLKPAILHFLPLDSLAFANSITDY